MTDFTEVKTEEISTFFVNSTRPPDEIHPLDNYKFGDDTKKHLFRLHIEVYIVNSIRYSTYTWRSVEIKLGCLSAVRQLCDSVIGIKELIK